MEQIIVNEKDEVIGYKERGTLSATDIYRVSALWVLNEKGEVLLARRAYDKDKDPGKFGPAVAGTVEKGETYESNIIKEAEEELNLKNINMEKLIKKRTTTPYDHFTQWFILRVTKENFKPKHNKEVAELGWFSEEELKNSIKNKPEEIINSMKLHIDILPFQ